VKTKIRKRLLI